MIRSEQPICSLGCLQASHLLEDVTDLMEEEQQQPGISHLLQAILCWEGHWLSCCTQVKAGNICFVLLPTCFQKEQPQTKKWQNAETLAGLTSILERFVQLEEWHNTKLICMWVSWNPHWKNCGKQHEGRGKYPVNVASDKCSCCHYRYPVPTTELKIVFGRSLAWDLESDAGFMQLPQ